MLPLTRACYAAVLLCAPGAAIRLCTGREPSSRARAVARVLAARHLTQAIVTTAAPNRAVLAISAQIDMAHAASMLALAAAKPRLRRAALADAAVAVVLAAGAR